MNSNKIIRNCYIAVISRLIFFLFLFVLVYVILGHFYEHIGLMVAMEQMKLFDKGKLHYKIKYNYTYFKIKSKYKLIYKFFASSVS